MIFFYWVSLYIREGRMALFDFIEWVGSFSLAWRFFMHYFEAFLLVLIVCILSTLLHFFFIINLYIYFFTYKKFPFKVCFFTWFSTLNINPIVDHLNHRDTVLSISVLLWWITWPVFYLLLMWFLVVCHFKIIFIEFFKNIFLKGLTKGRLND